MKYKGFTLLELLVVVIIIGIMAGLALFSLGDNRPRQVRNEAERLYKTMHWLSESAVQYQQNQGLLFTTNQYAQVTWNSTDQQWQLSEENEFTRQLPSFIGLHIAIEGEEMAIEGEEIDTVNSYGNASSRGEERENTPDIIFYSNGENSLFRVSLGIEDTGILETISSQGFGDFKREQVNAQ